VRCLPDLLGKINGSWGGLGDMRASGRGQRRLATPAAHKAAEKGGLWGGCRLLLSLPTPVRGGVPVQNTKGGLAGSAANGHATNKLLFTALGWTPRRASALASLALGLQSLARGALLVPRKNGVNVFPGNNVHTALAQGADKHLVVRSF